MPVASRLTNTGTLLVNGSFDEASLAAGAISFNGTSQYLTGTSPNLSGTWTVEMWCYWTTGATQTTIISFNNGSNSGINLWKNTSNQLVADDGINAQTAFSTVTPTINAWNHIAFVRNGTTTSGYINGVLAGTNTFTPQTTSAVSVGRYNSTPFYYFPGYISNLRVVNGTAVYTAAFTPPTAILPAISGTSLLLNVTDSTNFIRDNSPNNYTLTNNGTATFTALNPINQNSSKGRTLVDTVMSNTLDEFTGAPVVDASLMLWLDAAQTASYPGSGTTWIDLSPTPKNYTLGAGPTFTSAAGGGAITFDGASSQYAIGSATLFDSTTYNTYTMNLWVYPTGAGNFVQVNGQSTPNTSYHYSAIEISAAGVIKFGQWTGTIATIATSTQSLNAWYNLVITYNGTTATAYVNGVSVGSSAIAWSSPGANTFMALMAIDSTNMGTGAYASGSIGSFMVYNRALTLAEITQNYNALCNRYGKSSITTTQMPVVRRQLSSGTLLVNGGEFDEFTGAPIVDSSLLQWVDAAQKASYPGTGTTFTSLAPAGSNLTGVPAFSTVNGGAIPMLATNAINSSTNINVTGPHTISVWLNQSVSNATVKRYLTVGTATESIVIRNDGVAAVGQLHYYANIGGTSQSVRVNSQVVVNQNVNFVGTWDGTTMTVYKNGVSVGSLSASGALTGNSLNQRISSTSAAESFLGNFYQAQLYARAFSAAEVLTNFNALRNRYGI